MSVARIRHKKKKKRRWARVQGKPTGWDPVARKENKFRLWGGGTDTREGENLGAGVEKKVVRDLVKKRATSTSKKTGGRNQLQGNPAPFQFIKGCLPVVAGLAEGTKGWEDQNLGNPRPPERRELLGGNECGA